MIVRKKCLQFGKFDRVFFFFLLIRSLKNVGSKDPTIKTKFFEKANVSTRTIYLKLSRCAFRYSASISSKKLHESWESQSAVPRNAITGEVASVVPPSKLLITNCIRVQVVSHYISNYRFSSQTDYPRAAIMRDSV